MIKKILENHGHVITLPNTYRYPAAERKYRELGYKQHSEWKAGMFRQSLKNIENNDAVLVLNFEKNKIPNYIGGATFIEMYDAFRLKKKIFLYNDIPTGIFKDEIIGFNPTVIHGELDKII
ncbi:MAG: hypothetical protein A2722_04435 [Candidatus Doudnabacteria bacterium RIFCSPHIGHO2_01_FULL_50_11]|uniref:Nucleoside 2-deoxyribosyltransferase n=1 Tax=Candidatus Doudnabacteria bacterium RIFCSPHIGHO2_01_FULL_50_11 TaxID=1817828 RepID=A0A1F5PH00_9BACT|nr:MAG: hypothetical protein A2722_04435 [Candidatus Doudnabacteria bacterium RIFCSPHIGHO2_01_FULL_50_11]HLC44490.1 hypothetical protein [Patescibacteria group bacterium]